MREAWHVIEPSNPYVHGWHLDAIAEHLEAVTYNQITRLLINVPPGTAKSVMVSVLWPAWEWGPCGIETTRYISTSYSENFVKRDSRRMRDLVLSDWYQERWGNRVQLLRSGESSFENTHTGWREGMPFGSLTGGRAHRLIFDDPHSTEMAESDADRARTIRIFRESVTTRLIEPSTSAIIGVMQRLHTDDVSGTALALNLGYEHLCLPMEFEPDRRCVTSIGFKDPRTYEGELLFPERFPREVVDRDKAAMGSFAVASQFQQRPTLREGGLFKRSWFRMVNAAPAGTRWVRCWDLAATEDQLGSRAAYTVGLKLGVQPSGKFIVGDVVRQRSEGQGVRQLIKETAKADGRDVEIGLPIDPGQAGKVQAQDMVLMLAGYVVHAQRESGDKITRAEPVAAQAEAGNLEVLEAPWNDAFIAECCDFPGGSYRDQVDALSGAFGRLIGRTVFTEPETRIAADPVRIPATWPRTGAIDITRESISVVWMARDPSADTVYVYDTYAVPRRDMAIHAEAMRLRGKWIPFVFDMEADSRSRDEGIRLSQHLDRMGIELLTVPLDEEAAIEEVASRLVSGRLRVFEPQQAWFAEHRRYSRKDDGKLENKGVGLMRATCLAVASGLDIAITENRANSNTEGFDRDEYDRVNRNNVTGY